MTEKSYLWDGIAAGDATLAPYNAQEFGTWMFSHFLSNNLTEGYVIPGYLDDLAVRGAGTGSYGVVVSTGAACFNNYLYILDEAVSIPLTRLTGAQYRRDVIVLRADLNVNKIRLAVVEGAVSASPYVAEPTLTRTGGIYEIALATVLVIGDTAWNLVSAYGRTYVDDRYVLDRRKFIFNLFQQTREQGGSTNLVRNSEWLVQPNATAAGRPSEWANIDVSGLGAVGGGTQTLTTLGSGRDYGYTLATGQKIAQWIKINAHTFTVKVAYEFAAIAVNRTLEVGLQAYRIGGTASSINKITTFAAPGYSGEFIFTVTFPEDDIEKLYLFLYSADNAEFSQILLQPGYHVGGYRQVPGVVMFDTALTDASWAITAKSSATTTIDLAASFGPLIRNYTKAVILRLRGRDSGSAAAANCRMSALGYAAPFNSTYGVVELTGVTNSVWRETRAVVPVDQIYWGTGVAGAQFRLVVVATGAGTFDATVEIVGVIL